MVLWMGSGCTVGMVPWVGIGLYGGESDYCSTSTLHAGKMGNYVGDTILVRCRWVQC